MGSWQQLQPANAYINGTNNNDNVAPLFCRHPSQTMAKTTELHPHTPYWQKRRLLAENLKALQLLLLSREIPEEYLDRLNSLLTENNRQLDNYPVLAGKKAWGESGRYGDEDSWPHVANLILAIKTLSVFQIGIVFFGA